MESNRSFLDYWKVFRRQYAPGSYLCYGLGRALDVSDYRSKDADRLQKINVLGAELNRLDTASLSSRGAALRDRVRSGIPESEETILIESFALVREMSHRLLQLRPYDVQILGGLAMARGTIAEMATGEGKTLVQLLAAYYLGLSGRGVHLATANSYLATRDQEFGAAVLKALGLTSALLPERGSPVKKRQAYDADITYGNGSEFGFDYLRDQLILLDRPTPDPGEKILNEILGRERDDLPVVQRGLYAAILDEADSILIDEAVTPLLISGRSDGENPAGPLYQAALELADRLQEGTDFTVDPVSHRIEIADSGYAEIHLASATIDKALLHRPWQRYVENALRARCILRRDHQYLIRDNAVMIIAESPGRVKEGSSWRNGLHQAVEARESLPITNESAPQASISRQKFFKLYKTMCGMTGTAMEAAGEFWRMYRLPVVEIPKHRPSRHELLPTRMFETRQEKLSAAVNEICELYHLGRPVLAGARSIETCEIFSEMLTEAGVKHQMLNANKDADEAEIVAQAGQPRAVTISTAMAGRGTHINLGDGVEALGGLHVQVLEMEESQRIDRQLLGRAGRQGKPGSGRIYLSLEDHLVTRFAPELPGQNDFSEHHYRRLQSAAEVRAYHNRLAVVEQDRWNDETKLRLVH